MVAMLIAIIIGILAFLVFAHKYNNESRNMGETQLGYARYSIEKNGGEIKSFDRYSLTMVYVLENKMQRMRLKYSVMRYRDFSRI